MARKFLYIVATLIVLVLAGALALNYWSKELTEFTFVPRGEFVEQQPFEANAYEDPDMWFSRPGIGLDDPARWQPAMKDEGRVLPDADEDTPEFAVFFVHPTSYLDRANWNAPLDDEDANRVARLYLKGMASPFNRATEIWAPRYRQATFGAFLVNSDEARRAVDTAYRDVALAFAYFLASVDENRPIVLAGHSQGALHLLRLIRDEVHDKPVASRIAAIYAVGWPVSVKHDLPRLGFPACATSAQSGCLLTWSSFAEPADPSAVLDAYRVSTGLDGEPRGDSPILCTNPLTGGIGGEAPASENLGTLVPHEQLDDGELVPGLVPARCDSQGLLLIGSPPEMGRAVLPGNNYHVYDIPLFWKNIQEDVTRRVSGWAAAR